MFSVFKKWILSLVAGNAMNLVFLGLVAVLIMLLVIPNYQRVKGLLGFETLQSVKKELIQEKHNLDVAIEANHDTQLTLDDVVSARNDAMETIERIQDSVDTTKEIAKLIVTKRDETIKTSMKLTKKTPVRDQLKEVKSSTLTQEQEYTVAKANINAVWEAYCSFNENTECPQGA